MKNMLFQAKQIRKMAYEGKTKNEIMSELGLSEAQFQYRLKKVYSESAVKSLRKKLKQTKREQMVSQLFLILPLWKIKILCSICFRKALEKSFWRTKF